MIDIAYVTGSTGKIGSELVTCLLEKNILVIGVGRFLDDSKIAIKIFENDKNTIKINDSIQVNEWNIVDENTVINLFRTEEKDICNNYFFHLAWGGEQGLTGGGFNSQTQNIGLSAKYLDLSKRLKVTKFINSGSIDEIFCGQVY